MVYLSKFNSFLSIGLIYILLTLLPFGLWYDVGEVEVFDSVVGEEVTLETSGGVKRNFLGSYTVLIKDSTRETVLDADGGPFPYRTDSDRPEVITLHWWANGDPRAKNLPAGTYSMTTCWTVHRPIWGLLPDKHKCTGKVFFKIKEEEYGT